MNGWDEEEEHPRLDGARILWGYWYGCDKLLILLPAARRTRAFHHRTY